MKTQLFLFGALVSTASLALAQQADVFICDVTQDQLLRLADLDGDGVYITSNEATSFWTNGSGGVTSASPVTVEMRQEVGVPTAYFKDNNTDIFYRAQDLNGNGLIDPGSGEDAIFRDSGTLDGNSNSDGLALPADGSVWWTGRYDGGTSPMRGAHRMLDLNGDGDAEDAGELVTIVPDNGTVVAPSAVTGGNVLVDTENFTRMTELGNGVVIWTGYSGTFSNDFCTYRFEDLNGDGDILDAGEAVNFLNAVSKNPSLDQNVDFASGLLRDLATVDTTGVPSGHARFMHLTTLIEGGKQIVYVASDSSDTGNFALNAAGQGTNGLIYRCEDLNLDRDCNDAGEVTLYFDGSSTSGSNSFPKIVGMDGVGSSLYVASLGNDTVIFRLEDLNGDGDAMDFGEFDDNGGVGLWDPNSWGSIHGDYPVDFDPVFLNYHVFTVDIGAYGAGAWGVPAPGFVVSGVGCSKYSSDIPTIHGSGTAQIGTSNFTTEMKNVPGGMPAALIVGTNTNNWLGIPLPFDLAFLGASGCNLYHNWQYTFWSATTGAGATDGVASMALPIPSLPSLVGFDLPLQWAVLSLTPLGFDLGVTPLGVVTIQ